MLKEKLKEATATNASAKWRNLLFDKNGKCWKGNNLWPTQAKAAEIIRNVENIISSPQSEGHIIVTTDGYLELKDYAWSMQIPVLDKE